MKKTILICGAHFTPALAVLEQLRNCKKYQIIYFGRKFPLEGDSLISLEYKYLRKLKIPFYSIIYSRFPRTLSWHLPVSLLKFPISLIQSLYYIFKIKPALILSFGGYVALPICLAGNFRRIPIITHEQTRKLGLANSIIARFAKVLCLGWSNTQGVPKNIKTIVTGNPIRKAILANIGYKPPQEISEIPLIYITGGSLGSHSINKVISKVLHKLTLHYRIIHQCGSSNGLKDYKYLCSIKKKLPIKNQNNYIILENIDPDKVAKIYQQASIMIGRSGVNTITELIAVGLPSVLIPLPWAGKKEQEDNADMLKEFKMSETVKQRELTGQKLLEEINKVMKNLSWYKQNAVKAKNKINLDAAERIINLIKSYA